MDMTIKEFIDKLSVYPANSHILFSLNTDKSSSDIGFWYIEIIDKNRVEILFEE